MLLGLTGLALFRIAGGGGLPTAGPDDSRESLEGQRGLIGSLQQNKSLFTSLKQQYFSML